MFAAFATRIALLSFFVPSFFFSISSAAGSYAGAMMPSTKLSIIASAVAASTVTLKPTIEPKALRSSQARAIR